MWRVVSCLNRTLVRDVCELVPADPQRVQLQFSVSVS